MVDEKAKILLAIKRKEMVNEGSRPHYFDALFKLKAIASVGCFTKIFIKRHNSHRDLIRQLKKKYKILARSDYDGNKRVYEFFEAVEID